MTNAPTPAGEFGAALGRLSALLTATHLTGDSPVPGLGAVSWNDLRILAALAPVAAEGGEVRDRVYIDCEFDGHGGPLLSMALVREDGDSIHIRADVEPMDIWVRQNVLPLMDSHHAMKSVKVYYNEVGGIVREFLGDGSSPAIIADSLQDARYFSQALTTASDGGYSPFPFRGLTFEVHNVDCYPTDLEGAVQHNAWWDAMALRQALSALRTEPTGGGER